MFTYSYKTINSDFRVTEIQNICLNGGDYHYYILNKQGYRTADVVDIIAAQNNIDASSITYAGLKDEDAITMQYIAIKGQQIEPGINEDGEKSFSLYYVGSDSIPIQIGNLLGNAFYIRLRNLEKSVAEYISAQKKHAVSIVNYFGVQRFGMPNLPKVSHIVGKYIIEKNSKMALDYLRRSGNIDENTFDVWEGNPEGYLKQMEKRRKSFFLSAYDSNIWNTNIMNAIADVSPRHTLNIKEGIKYIYPYEIDDKVRTALESQEIVWHRFDENDEIYEKRSFRQPYLEIVYRASEVFPDSINEGRYMVDIEFVLPAGAYATNAVDQIMNFIEFKMHNETLSI